MPPSQRPKLTGRCSVRADASLPMALRLSDLLGLVAGARNYDNWNRTFFAGRVGGRWVRVCRAQHNIDWRSERDAGRLRLHACRNGANCRDEVGLTPKLCGTPRRTNDDDKHRWRVRHEHRVRRCRQKGTMGTMITALVCFAMAATNAAVLSTKPARPGWNWFSLIFCFGAGVAVSAIG